MKKIFFMINSMGIGGAEKSLSSLLNLIDNRKYQIYLQLIHQGGTFEKLLPEHVNILPPIPYFQFCRQSNSKQLISGNFRFLRTRIMVNRHLSRNNRKGKPLHPSQAFWQGASSAFDVMPEEYDIAVAWGQGTPTHFVADKVKARKKIAWINAEYDKVGHNPIFDLDIYGKYNNIVCVSEKLTELLRQVFPEFADRMVTIYDINSAELIETMASEPINMPPLHGTVITTVGRLEEQKGYDIAVEAARILKDDGLDFTWMVCGEGRERKMLENRIAQDGLQKYFLLLGGKPNPYPYMKAADIYVQTSRFEGYCLALTEARILNRPCVATRFDVVFDQMVQGENGLVVDLTPEAVAKSIERLIREKELYRHIQQYLKSERKGNEEEMEKVYRLLDM